MNMVKNMGPALQHIICGEVDLSDSEQCRSDGVESLNATYCDG